MVLSVDIRGMADGMVKFVPMTSYKAYDGKLKDRERHVPHLMTHKKFNGIMRPWLHWQFKVAHDERNSSSDARILYLEDSDPVGNSGH